ncbi:hypothetical protein CRN75_04190 [Yersinia frederiksenii]|nr:hypothetical protein CRN75_04190 [Yersinia frederiksenii]
MILHCRPSLMSEIIRPYPAFSTLQRQLFGVYVKPALSDYNEALRQGEEDKTKVQKKGKDGCG